MSGKPTKRKRGADDPAIFRRRPRWAEDAPQLVGPLPELLLLRLSQAEHDTDEGRARARLWDALNQLGVDPVIVPSPVHLALVQLFTELVQESKPHDTLEVVLEPLFALWGESTATLAAKGNREARLAAESGNLDTVLIAFLALDPRQREGRQTVGVIKRMFAVAEPPVSMYDSTVRKHLKQIRSHLSRH